MPQTGFKLLTNPQTNVGTTTIEETTYNSQSSNPIIFNYHNILNSYTVWHSWDLVIDPFLDDIPFEITIAMHVLPVHHIM